MVYYVSLFSMKKLLNKSHTNVHTIAYILGGVSIFGYVISFLRDRAFAHYFGAGELLDIYTASFRIPDMLFITATAFVSVYALLPMFEEKMRQSSVKFQEFINTSFYFLIFFLILGSTILFFAIPFLADTFFAGFTGKARETFILFSRVYLIQASFFSVSAFFAAILQLKRKFVLYSILPILYNAGIILGTIVLYPMFGSIGLAIGVVLGALLNAGIQIPILLHNNVLPRLAPTKHTIREFWRVIKTSIPRASALLSHGIAEGFVFGTVVSISQGALSVYYFAQSLKVVPLVVIGTAYSVASFPVLVTYFTEKNTDGFKRVINNALRRLLFFILPIIAFIFVLREPLVSLLFETGFFTAETTIVTSAIVAALMPHALTTSVLIICARAFYARGRSLVPFIIFFVLSAAKIALSYMVVHSLHHNEYFMRLMQGISSLETAEHTTLFATVLLVMLLEVVAAGVILKMLMQEIQQSLAALGKAFLQNMISALIMVVSIAVTREIFFAETVFNSLGGVIAIACMSAVGGVLWFVSLRLFKNKESDIVRKKVVRILSRIWKT